MSAVAYVRFPVSSSAAYSSSDVVQKTTGFEILFVGGRVVPDERETIEFSGKSRVKSVGGVKTRENALSVRSFRRRNLVGLYAVRWLIFVFYHFLQIGISDSWHSNVSVEEEKVSYAHQVSTVHPEKAQFCRVDPFLYV